LFNRILSALLWPGRKLAGLERRGQIVWSLAAVDAAGLGLWLFTLNGFVFNRSLDQDDYSTIMIVPVLCYAASLQYGLRPGQPWWRWILKALLGETVATLILRSVFEKLGMDLSSRQLVFFFALHFPLHLVGRGVYLWARNRLPGAPLELPRLLLVGGGGLGLISAFVTRALIGSGDAYWYSIVLHDFVAQWRAGLFPVFVGQTEYAFSGTINPLRFAPYFQHFAGMLDILTGRSLEFIALQNLTIVLSTIGGAYSAYFCTVSLLPRHRWTAAGLAVLYVACPGALVLAYGGNLFMSVMAMPYIPLVAYALWRSLEPGDRSGAVRTALPLAMVWWCHAPIALWLTLLAAAVHLVRLASRWRERAVYCDCGKGFALFALCAGFVFISVWSVHPPTEVVDRGLILKSLRSAFPGIFLPVSENGLEHADTQLGWSLWGVLLLSIAGFTWRPRRATGAILIGVAGFLLLLLPIPGLNSWLWNALPQWVCNITFYNADQRLYLITAGLIVIAGAAAAAGIVREHPKAALGFSLVVALGLGWSALEATKFVEQVFNFRPTPSDTKVQQEEHNVVLTRYSFGAFAKVPSYYSHGYVDPYLENRVLSADQNRVLFDNANAARPSKAVAPVIARIREDARGTLVLVPPITLVGGIRYAVQFEPLQSLPPGSLIAEGQSVFREYLLPDSGYEMPYATPERAFGFLPTSRDFFPLWTSHPGADLVTLRYVFRNPDAPAEASRAVARMRIQSYDVRQLPVKVERWAPYQATLASPIAGAWLETPRLFISGYRATVNGRPVPVGRSVDGRVLVPLVAGSNRIVLSYPGTIPLRGSYYLALATWILLGLRALVGLATSDNRNSRAPPHAPA
jgi:hypothetical protein